MKDPENDSTPVLERFGRDKRKRTVVATVERVERRPRLQRDAADSEQPSFENRPQRRASYNPNFTADNRPVFEKPHYDDNSRREGDRPRQYGDRPRQYGDRPREYGDRPRQYGDRPREYGDRPRQYGDRPREYDDRPRRSFGDKPRYDGDRRRNDEERPRRNPGDKPAYGERKFGPKKFGDKPHDGKKFGDRKFGDRKFGDRKFGDKPFRPGYGNHDDKPVSYPKFNPEKQLGEMRLNRFIAQSGICSRREADDFITAGVVSVNGKIVTELGTKVLPTDEVRFNDEPVQGEKKVYLVLNKPKGYVTSLDDPHAGKTVMELVAGACTERIYPVGRLDKNSLGLLLFTNDGDLTKQLTHPSYKKKKIYQVTLDKPLTRADMDRIAEGVTLEDGEIFADEISYVKENKQEVGIEIHSGRNRIVRRIFEFLGYTVTKLDRVYYAGLTKKNLKRGAWRFLTREEVERLKSGQYE
ncbi:pseudouridine synthase [Alistipes sp.]|uniref:pseudouridine synthase n=1 Tax=Alistipes sp. TaxID=1872444 RepID=UPI0025C4333A|nr:pseudouridine synthase [Alistipes sp.]